MPSPPAFLITIDAEGDDVWSHPDPLETKNAAFLPRFHDLCRRHGFLPTYLTNHEMALDPVYDRFARGVLDDGSAEVGMHLHAWDTPPPYLAREQKGVHPYLIDYPEEPMHRKVGTMTDLLADRFGKPTSHRAGRWALDARYVRILKGCGYRVDCSVTPQVSWRQNPGHPEGHGGTDYSAYPDEPYWMDLDRIEQPNRPAGASSAPTLVEVPMTTVRPPMGWAAFADLRASFPAGLADHLVRVARRSPWWLRPERHNLPSMLWLVERAARQGRSNAMFMLHSSEFMPGGSPTFRTAESIERLYRDLETLFARAAALGFRGRTLTGFADDWARGHG
jgi:hypothetical protein